MPIDRNQDFIAPNEGLLVMTDYAHLRWEGHLHEGPFTKDDAVEMTNQHGGEYQALRVVMKGNRVDHTELPEDVTEELIPEEARAKDDEEEFTPWTREDEADRAIDEMQDRRAFG